jgi:predicted PurR-regulated permease PerM
MDDGIRALRSWFIFAGVVLIVVVLYWAQAVLIPVAMAILLTFVLTPAVIWFQRWIGRVPAVLLIVALAFAVLGLAGWGLERQMSSLAADLPGYRQNIREKIRDVRGAGKGGSVEKIQDTLKEIQTEIGKPNNARGTSAEPIVVSSDQVASLWGFPAWLGPLMGPLATAGLVVVMVIFMLLEREDLRNRLIGLIGHGHLAVTTKAFDEASSRVSRQLLMQSLVNITYGALVWTGLYFIGVPYAMVCAILAAALRFIPYVGPIIGAGLPILIGLAALPGWGRPMRVMGLFLALELFTNLVLETILYAGAAGVSQVALLVAVAFWTWLWGPMGLLMATPLTVCMVVLGKHVAGLEFLATLMADVPALAPDVSYYQRLLAKDQSEASDLIERYIRTQDPAGVYDALLLPALNYAERDRAEGRLVPEEETGITDGTRELLADTAAFSEAAAARHPHEEEAEEAVPRDEVAIFAYAVNVPADELALLMLKQLLRDVPCSLEVPSARLGSTEITNLVRDQPFGIVCIADLPPSAPSKTRYLVKKLRASNPHLKILVGRWAPPLLIDENPQTLLDAGATHVASTLIETRDQLREIIDALPRGVSTRPAAAAAQHETDAA